MNSTNKIRLRLGQQYFRIYIIGIAILILQCYYGNATQVDFLTLIEDFRDSSQTEFMESFPFNQYYQDYQHRLHEVKLLESHRQRINEMGFNGDLFLMKVFRHRLAQDTLDCTNIESVRPIFELAEIMHQSEKYLPDSVFVYNAISGLLFETIADSLQKLIYDEEVDVSNFQTRYLITRLGDYKYLLDCPTSNTSKVWKYIKQGRWDYIWHKMTSTYFKEFMVLIAGGVGTILLLFLGWRRLKRNQRAKEFKLS